jgi:hypothetical protein
MSRPSLRRYFKIGQQKVHMELPENAKITKVELLKARTSAYKQTGNVVEFIIPSIEDFELAALYKS